MIAAEGQGETRGGASPRRRRRRRRGSRREGGAQRAHEEALAAQAKAAQAAAWIAAAEEEDRVARAAIAERKRLEEAAIAERKRLEELDARAKVDEALAPMAKMAKMGRRRGGAGAEIATRDRGVQGGAAAEPGEDRAPGRPVDREGDGEGRRREEGAGRRRRGVHRQEDREEDRGERAKRRGEEDPSPPKPPPRSTRRTTSCPTTPRRDGRRERRHEDDRLLRTCQTHLDAGTSRRGEWQKNARWTRGYDRSTRRTRSTKSPRAKRPRRPAADLPKTATASSSSSTRPWSRSGRVPPRNNLKFDPEDVNAPFAVHRTERGGRGDVSRPRTARHLPGLQPSRAPDGSALVHAIVRGSRDQSDGESSAWENPGRVEGAHRRVGPNGPAGAARKKRKPRPTPLAEKRAQGGRHRRPRASVGHVPRHGVQTCARI